MRSIPAPRYALCLVVAFGVFRAADGAAAPPSFAPPLERHVLPNGMRVVLAPDAALDDVTTAVVYRVGSSADPAGMEGLAHVARHMMFEGSSHVGPGEHVKLLEAAGGSSIESTSGPGRTVFYETTPPAALPLALWLESDRMGYPAPIDRGVLEREWKVTDAEVDENRRGSGARVNFEAAWAEVFPEGHPYHRADNGHALGEIDVADVSAFRRTWYTPANATLLVVGPIDVAATLALVNRYFGALRSDALPERPSVPDSRKVPDVWVEARANLAHDGVTISWPTPALGRPGDAALDLAATILAGHAGPLNESLVAKGLAVQVSANQRSMGGGSMFTITALAGSGSPETLVDAIEKAVADLGAHVSDAEVESARLSWSNTVMLRLETSRSRARELAGRDEPSFADKYSALRAADVQSVVQQTLMTKNRVVTIARSDPREPWYGVITGREERAK